MNNMCSRDDALLLREETERPMTITGMTFNQFCAHLADEKREERRIRRLMRKQLVVHRKNAGPLETDVSSSQPQSTPACSK